MTRRRPTSTLRPALFLAGLLSLTLSPVSALAQNYYAPQPQPGTRIITVAPGQVATAPGTLNNYGRLGSFYPTPYLMVRGNAPAGGGYSPLGSFGDTTLSLYGPLSSERMTAAPVMTYSRGYDGRTIVTPGTSFSTPNLPALTPVINPTRASYYYGFRRSKTPPWWANGINWIDQN